MKNSSRLPQQFEKHDARLRYAPRTFKCVQNKTIELFVELKPRYQSCLKKQLQLALKIKQHAKRSTSVMIVTSRTSDANLISLTLLYESKKMCQFESTNIEAALKSKSLEQ